MNSTLDIFRSIGLSVTMLRYLIRTRGEINFFWFVEDWEIMVSVVGVDPARLKLSTFEEKKVK